MKYLSVDELRKKNEEKKKKQETERARKNKQTLRNYNIKSQAGGK